MSLKLLVLVGACLLALAVPADAGALVVETPPSLYEQTNREAKEAAQKAEEKEKAAAEQKKTEEREKIAAAEREVAEEHKAVEERSQREAAERGRREEAELVERERSEEAAAVRCVVPLLQGDSLRRARAALRRAHCELGGVTVPRGGHRGRVLVVRGQSLRRGTKYPAHTAVAITLGPAKGKSR